MGSEMCIRDRKDLRQAEEELQQLHFNEQPAGGFQLTRFTAPPDPSTTNDVVWQYISNAIAQGGYHSKPAARDRSPARRAGGDEHSSHSDEELIDVINDPYFKPVRGSE